MDTLINELEKMCCRECVQRVGELITKMEPVICAMTNGSLNGRTIWNHLCATGNLIRTERYYDVTTVGRHNGFIRLFRYNYEGNRYPIVVCTPQAQRYLVNCVRDLLADYMIEKG